MDDPVFITLEYYRLVYHLLVSLSAVRVEFKNVGESKEELRKILRGTVKRRASD